MTVVSFMMSAPGRWDGVVVRRFHRVGLRRPAKLIGGVRTLCGAGRSDGPGLRGAY
ncbi:hypothetical protein GCM10019016_125540 [Streptomyces prasinosporus]|uniref:Uncharacterized protein n=1 Tax=Streptomyces prasinosporus TaxID=68256 RepID=A0ABP6UG67_9ACTN|nr:hypothetical protein GCM10010332_01500 [Streptomyces albogriseolus]